MALDRAHALTGDILITGGTGTLGHAIVLMAEKQQWDCRFTIYSRSELRLATMRQRFPSLRTVVGDVRDYERLRAAVMGHNGVIHAAAMKRIPECEESPRECYLTNVAGSENVARACFGGVEWVVGISTDKACQASTCYGASKLMMESIFLASSKRRTMTRYHLVRYGNVIASHGSVIPLWRAKYEKGEALPITNISMTRFWMSPFDAVEAILAGQKIGPGLIYVPKVGAASMTAIAIHLFPNCRFEETGLRSNEKVHESLVSVDEIAIQREDCFIIGIGSLGQMYRSSTADVLRMESFNGMLKDAEEVEQSEH